MQRHVLAAPRWLWAMGPGRAGRWWCSCSFSSVWRAWQSLG